MTTTEIAGLTDDALNHHLALAEGYTCVGPMRGVMQYHPPGERNRVVPCPQYIRDWNLVIPLVFRQAMLETLIGALRDGRDGGTAARRSTCEALLTDLLRPRGRR